MLAQLEPSVIVSRWFHLATVIVAVGGTVFIRFLLQPAERAALPDEAGQPLRDLLFRRWARVLHACIAILIITGTYNAIVQFPRHQPSPGVMPLYHVIFTIKVLLVLPLFFIAIGMTGRSRTFEALRRNRPVWLAVSVVLAACIVLLSNLLKNIPPAP